MQPKPDSLGQVAGGVRGKKKMDGNLGARYALGAKLHDCRHFPLATGGLLNLRVALASREPHVLRINTRSAPRSLGPRMGELLGWTTSCGKY